MNWKKKKLINWWIGKKRN